MPMGIVNDDDFLKELENSGSNNQVKKPEIIDLPTKGRQKGSVEVPDSLRKIIGETSELEGRKSALALADSFGISKSSVSAYSNGAHSTASYETPTDVASHIQSRKDRVAKSALSILRRSFGAISEDKLKDSDAKELSSVAKDMAAIVKMMEPETKDNTNTVARPQFVVFAPVMRDESHFEVIQSKE